MRRILTQEWLDRQQEETEALEPRTGASASIQYDVTGGPDGPVSFHTRLENGRISENCVGTDDEADFTMVMPFDEFVAVARGDADPTVGFMQGRVKVTGNIGRMLSVLPATTSEPWRAAMRRVAADTDFG